MAGPGKTGPPSRGHGEVEQMLLEAQVLNLHDRNYTQREIAAVVGMDHSSIHYMLKRINNRTLADFDRVTTRGLKLRQIHRIQQSLAPFVINERGVQDFMPDPKMTLALLRAIKAERELMGADAPTRIELSATGEDGEGEEIGMDEAAAVTRFMELADQMAKSGYGSGRIIDAEVVEDDDEVKVIPTPENRVTGPGSNAPQLELRPGPSAVQDDDYPPGDDPPDPNDGVDDDPIGVWRDGKFYPTPDSDDGDVVHD